MVAEKFRQSDLGLIVTLILKTKLAGPWYETNALCLLPSGDIRSERAIFAHGYTANKSDCLPWATRCTELGIPSLIFDWPGHYLGGFNEVENFSDFTDGAHKLFGEAYTRLQDMLEQQKGFKSPKKVILGGHSLGALMAIKALNLNEFNSLERLAIGVGIGLNNKVETHLFDTEFYQKTLAIRRQLVSPALDSDLMFPWIRDEKTRLQLSGERIHLITGEDDMVVGVGGLENFSEHLLKLNNHVTLFKPKKLAHHEPTLAAPHLNAFLKTELGF